MSRIIANGLHNADARVQELLRRCLQTNPYRVFREIFRVASRTPNRKAFDVFLESIEHGVWDDQTYVPLLVHGSGVAPEWQVEAIGCFLKRARQRTAGQLNQLEAVDYDAVRSLHRQRCNVPTHAGRLGELFEAAPAAVAIHVAEEVFQIIRDLSGGDGECLVWSAVLTSRSYLSTEDVLLLATVDALAFLASHDPPQIERLRDKFESISGRLGMWIKLRVYQHGSRDLRSKGLELLRLKIEKREDLNLVDGLVTVASFLASSASDDEWDGWTAFEPLLLKHTTESELQWTTRDKTGWSIVGRQAFQLLAYIKTEHLSDAGLKRLNELKRLFGATPPQLTWEGEGGIVSRVDTNISGLDMSDEGWLNYLKNADPKSSSFLLEPDVCCTLREYVQKDPHRFCNLLLDQFDDEIPPDRYIAVVEGLGFLLQSVRIGGNEKAESTTELDCKLVFEVCRATLNRDVERSIGGVRFALYNVWMAQGCKPPSDLFDELLCQAVSHPNPAKDRQGSELFQAGINSIRGSITTFIAELITDDEQLFHRSRDFIVQLVEDDTDQVRACVIEALISSLNHDQHFAKEQFLRLVADASDTLLSVPSVARFVSYGLTVADLRDDMVIVCKRLLQLDGQRTLESVGEVLVVGAYHSEEMLALLKDEIGSDNEHVLRGAAKVLTRSFEDLPEELRQVLLRIADAPIDEVASLTSNCFFGLEGKHVEDLDSFILDFVKTRAFAVQPGPLIRFLDKARAQMTTVALSVCEQVLSFNVEVMSDIPKHQVVDAHAIAELLMRLYVDNSDNASLQQQVLDLIDEMVRHDMWAVHSSLRNFSDE